MPEDSIPRDRHAIEQDIANIGVKIAQLSGSLRTGETAEQIGDAPGRLTEAANELLRFARELHDVWPA